MLTQEQILVILHQFHLVSHEWSAEPSPEEVATVQVLYAQLDHKSKEIFKEDCSELISWIQK